MTTDMRAGRLTWQRTELADIRPWLGSAFVRLLALAAALSIAAAVAILMTAPRAVLTSDESLYVSEALNIAKGIGPRYSTLELVQHRPFLFPALLAVPLRIGGGDPASVYWLTKSVVLLNVLAVGALVRLMRGNIAAMFTIALVLPNAFLNSMGVSAYLDGMETFFLLISMLFLWIGRERGRAWCWMTAGAALGLAFLTKEAAILWFPLPAIVAMTTDAQRDFRRSAIACAMFGAGFAAVAGWWWPYVYAVDGRVYLWPSSMRSLALIPGALLVLGGAGSVAYRIAALRSETLARRFVRSVGIVVAIAWVTSFTVVMESKSWPYPNDFAGTIPGYVRHVVAGNLMPWPLAAAAVAWLAWRARRCEAERLLALGLLLWAPFAIFAAHRGFALRDLLPMLYLTYAGAGLLLADVSSRLRQGGGAAGAIGVAAIVAAVAAGAVVGERTFYRHAHGELGPADWDNALVRRTAAWIDAEVAPGTPIMSSRLYFSQLYTRTDARYPIAQLPTLNVVPQPGREPYLMPRSTLFRWEDDLLATPRADERWISVDEFPAKHYFTALSEDDLLGALRRQQTGLLIVSGEDAAFSSTRYVDYFRDNTAFQLVHEDHEVYASIYVFRVDGEQLARRDYATVVPASVLNHLYERHRGGLTASNFIQAISARGVVVRPSVGLNDELRGVTVVGD